MKNTSFVQDCKDDCFHGAKKKSLLEERGFQFLVPLTELFSNNFMDNLEEIWKLRAYIPDPTTPSVLYRNSDAEDIFLMLLILKNVTPFSCMKMHVFFSNEK